MKSKYLKGFFLLTLVLFTCISVASATDALEDTTSDVTEMPTVTSEQDRNNTIQDKQQHSTDIHAKNHDNSK